MELTKNPLARAQRFRSFPQLTSFLCEPSPAEARPFDASFDGRQFITILAMLSRKNVQKRGIAQGMQMLRAYML
jgi:hypothetical protein